MISSQYYYKNSQFIIKNYNKTKTFANFLPGLAGKRGIPLWAFYVNRAQLISGFGLQDKNHPISLFHSANKAYETVGRDGFRTFIKCNSKIYEPFNINNNFENLIAIEPHKVTIEEVNDELNIKVVVSYFGLPNEELAGLVRTVKIINLVEKPIDLEVIDGLAEVLPAGLRTDEFKALSNLLQSWMDVENLDEGFGFYKLRGSTGDSAEVSEVREGNFYFGFDNSGLLKIIADRDLIFSYDTSKTNPVGFARFSVDDLLKEEQVNKNKVPAAFIPLKISVEKEYEFFAVAGHTHSLEALRNKIKSMARVSYIKTKETEAKSVIESLLKDVDTESGIKEFDAYIKQNYLDNLLRGGYPMQIGKQIYHIYARKHGDLERDYNFFSLAPEYYSTGPGNFRDVAQNRRLDSMIHPEVKFFNVYQFGNLIQLDGYNPLSVNGVTYKLNDSVKDALVEKHFGKNKEKLSDLFSRNFTPGDLVNYIDRNNIEVLTSEEDYLAEIINGSDLKIEAHFGEGYWIDHFTYFLDLVESFEAVYPDQFMKQYLEEEIFMYFKSPIRILKQTEKSVKVAEDKIRQYKSLEHLEGNSDFHRMGNEYYKSNLFVKLFTLALNKFSLLDPDGLGVEMEGGKPGWNDAMNGLPGLYGSGVSETIELKRIIDFILEHPFSGSVKLPLEVKNLYNSIKTDFSYFPRVNAREKYRDDIQFGLSGEISQVDSEDIFATLKNMANHLLKAIDKLYYEYEGIVPTYLTYDVTDYEEIKDNNKGHNGYKLVKPLAFKRKAVSPFLEAPARLLKSGYNQEKLVAMAEKIKKSDLFDQALKQYKTSVPLDNDTFEIGRVKAFTPGWLERESNFLHMTYKYLLGLFKANLYEEFFEALKTNLVCFMNPEIYGRSILENSSFIATSNNPNPRIHGQGFFARLSGSTVEALNLWMLMLLGKKPFKYENEELIFMPQPMVSKEFFKEDKTLSFNFMKNIRITYLADDLVDTYNGSSIYKYELIDEYGEKQIMEVSNIRGKLAEAIRDGYYKKINIYIK
jgi:hypothetical protein